MSRRCKHCHLNQSIMDAEITGTASPLGLILFVVACCALFLYIYVSLFHQEKEVTSEEKECADSEDEEDDETEDIDPTSAHKYAPKKNKKVFKTHKHQFSSADLLTTFKGHVDSITSGAVSANGKGLVTASRDRTLFFYNLHDAFQKGIQALQGGRNNLPYDYAEKICWSPDFTAVVVHMSNAQTIEVLKGTKKSDGTIGNLVQVRQFDKRFPDRLVGLAVASDGRFIMTCNNQNQLSVWNLKGHLLASVNTNQGHTLHAILSMDNRFIATSGFTPDVMVFEVVYDKTDNFQSMKKVFELSGHNSRVFGSDFSSDCCKMATVSKDGTWKLFDTNVEYKQGQSPRLLVTGNVPQTRNVSDNNPCVVRLSPDNRIVLVAAEQSVLCYSTATAALVHSLLNIYAGPIVDMFFDAGSEYFVTTGDMQAHLFHNVAGYHATIQELEKSLSEATYSGMKERIKSQLDAARKALRRTELKRIKEATKKEIDTKKRK